MQIKHGLCLSTAYQCLSEILIFVQWFIHIGWIKNEKAKWNCANADVLRFSGTSQLLNFSIKTPIKKILLKEFLNHSHKSNKTLIISSFFCPSINSSLSKTCSVTFPFSFFASKSQVVFSENLDFLNRCIDLEFYY